MRVNGAWVTLHASSTSSGPLRAVGLAPLWVLAWALACGSESPTREIDPPDWRGIITDELLGDSPGDAVLVAEAKAPGEVYLVAYPPPPEAPTWNRSVAVEVQPAGRLLDPEEHGRALGGATEAERRAMFPSIGSRAMQTAPFVGPGGSTFGLVFTTQDERFDIEVTVSESGGRDGATEAVGLPDLLELSERIAKRYAGQVRRAEGGVGGARDP